MRIEAKIGLVSSCIILIAAACGGRSGPEIWGFGEDAGQTGGWGGGIVDGSPVGGSGGTSGGTGGAGGTSAGGTSGTGGVTPDADVPDVVVDAPPDGNDFFDAIPGWNCMTCLEQECKEEINACYNDPTCLSGVQCTITDCLVGGGGGGAGGGSGGGGGGIDMTCVLNCFDNDYGSAMAAFSMFTCITQSCGEECAGGLGGAGGGSGTSLNGLGMPSGLFGYKEQPAPHRRNYYIGTVRVPRPEEVAGPYPWLAELLSGRMPDPPPPCIARRRAEGR